MVKVRLYLDTSVPSAYFDSRAADRQRLTQEFWRERLSEFEGVISAVVLKEIRDMPDSKRCQEIEDLIRPMEVLPLSEDAVSLAQGYVQHGIFPEVYESDALHVRSR